MSLNEITNRVNALGSAWEQFKSVNDRRLQEIEKRGAADPLTLEQLNNINHALDDTKARLSQVETAVNRPAMALDYSYKSSDPMAHEHKAAFCAYLRKGVTSELVHWEQKALSVGSAPDGGYLVRPHISENIIKTVFETSPMRQVASVETISSDSLELIEDRMEADAGWTSETGARSDTNTPQISKKVIPVHEIYAQPKATQKLIDDAHIDIEVWLAEKLSDTFSHKENAAFINGDGVGKPRGILTYGAGTDWGQIEQIHSLSSGAITAEGIILLYYALKENYAVRASFMMNRASIQAVRLLKEPSTNQYIWQPGLATSVPDTLLGVPVIQAADMPVPSSGSLSVVVADFASAYQIVDRTGIRVLRDPFTDKPFVKFYTTKRVGGDVVNFEAVKLLKLVG